MEQPEDKQSTDLEAFPDRRCRLILIGKTGAGKSATGNTILGGNYFTSRGGLNSETEECGHQKTKLGELEVTVTDTPGLADTGGDDEKIATRIVRSLFAIKPGPHAVILCLRCDSRFTAEEYNVVCGLKDIFGEGMTEHLIVIMAGKDNYAKGINKNTSDPEVERLFEEELKRCKHLNNLLDESKRRYMLFDNEAGVDTKKQQVSQLFLMVKEMVVQNGGKYFVHKLAEEINQALNAMVEVKLGENGHYELILTKNPTEEEKPIPPEEGPVAPPDNSSSMKPYDPEASETQETAATSVDELVNPSETTEIAEPEYSEVDKAEVATEVRETREADTTAHATQSHQPDPFAPEEPQQEEPVYSGVKKNEENTTEETYSKEENDEEEDDEEDEDKELSHIEREQRERLRGIEEIRQFGTVRERLKRLSGGEQSPKPEPEAGKTKIWRQSSDQRETTRSITAPSQITSLLSQGKIGQDVIGVTKETESLQISHPHDWFEEEEDLNQLLEKLPGLPGLTLQEQREMIEEALKRKLATLPIENLTKAERERLEASATSIREKFKEGMKKWAVSKVDQCRLM